MKGRERHIKSELQRIRDQIRIGNESEIIVWVKLGKLACSQRPLRDHPQFGGRKRLPLEARPLVICWVERIKRIGIRSIICLLVETQLDFYSGLDLYERGLLGYYEA